MGFREDLGRRIDKKRAEIALLEDQLKTAKTYLQALEDMHKLASKDVSTSGSASSDHGKEDPSFREGSMTGLAYEAIKRAGKPLHVNELLPAIGREVTRAERSAISGTLGAYVRDGKVFTRPAPNTFGLVELSKNGHNGHSDPVPDAEADTSEPVPPPGFGKF